MKKLGYAVVLCVGMAIGMVAGSPLMGRAQSSHRKSPPSAAPVANRWQVLQDSNSVLPVILLDSATGNTWHVCLSKTATRWCPIELDRAPH